MANPGQPTIKRTDTGEPVKRAQRALRRTANESVEVDGIFGARTEEAVKEFQEGNGLVPDGIVGPQTWAKLPGGGAMPVLRIGSTGSAVRRVQQVLTDGAPGEWHVTPQGIDGVFGNQTRDSVEAFQKWAEVPADGVIGQRTWDASMHAAGANFETVVGLEFVVD